MWQACPLFFLFIFLVLIQEKNTCVNAEDAEETKA